METQFSIPKVHHEGRTGLPPVFANWLVPNGIDAMGERGSERGLVGLDTVAIPINSWQPYDQSMTGTSVRRLSRHSIGRFRE